MQIKQIENCHPDILNEHNPVQLKYELSEDGEDREASSAMEGGNYKSIEDSQ